MYAFAIRFSGLILFLMGFLNTLDSSLNGMSMVAGASLLLIGNGDWLFEPLDEALPNANTDLRKVYLPPPSEELVYLNKLRGQKRKPPPPPPKPVDLGRPKFHNPEIKGQVYYDTKNGCWYVHDGEHQWKAMAELDWPLGFYDVLSER